MITKNIIKIITALLSLVCLLDMPYGYFQFYRFVAFVVFAYLAIEEQNKDGWYIIWGISALLVQPFFKVALGREIWNIVDVLFAAILMISIVKNRK
jgi:hypothetical protein